MPAQEIQLESLHKSVLFAGLSAGKVDQIISAARWRQVEQGECVYRQGENTQCFYIVASGEIELTMHVETGRQFSVGHIGPGGHFGETSLLTNSRNSLSALALTNLSLLCFNAEAFNSVLLANPAILHQLSITLAKRLRVSFQDHANSLTKGKNYPKSVDRNLDPTFISGIKTSVSATTQTIFRLDNDRSLYFPVLD